MNPSATKSLKQPLSVLWHGIFVSVWVAVVILCICVLFSFQSIADSNTDVLIAPRDAISTSESTWSEPVVYVALHPHCPCTRLTLNELAELVVKSASKARMIFLVYIPQDEPAQWVEGKSTQLARKIPGSELVLDVEGHRSSSLGIKTSGGIVAYDRHGTLAFSGGVQAMRGMVGQSWGTAVLTALLEGQEITEIVKTPVYGCSLITPQTKRSGESYK